MDTNANSSRKRHVLVVEADLPAAASYRELLEMQGYGRAYPPGRRQVVGSVMHLSDSQPYSRLNDAVCVCVGEVRTLDGPERASSELVIDVAELIWEPIAE